MGIDPGLTRMGFGVVEEEGSRLTGLACDTIVTSPGDSVARRLDVVYETLTGAAPFMSVIKDPEAYERFEHVTLVHGVRWASETAVVRHRIEELRHNELLGELVRDKLHYYPTVTREPHANHGRLTALIQSGRLFRDLQLPPFDPASDRVMVCGSPAMLTDTRALLEARGFKISPHTGVPGDYVIERAFVER